MTNRLCLALACALLAVRLPSLVQPMGADQGLYAYVGERILDGGLPYRDAWDQKPPAIHAAYAAMRGVWPRAAVVPATDLAAAALAALLLWRLGTLLASPIVGQSAALLFLFLSNPSFARLGGVSVRAQCETFIAVAITGAFVLLAGSRRRPAAWRFAAAGALFGVAVVFKYNAAVYGAAGLVALFLWKRLTRQAAIALAAGVMLPIAGVVVWFAAGGALRALYDATIAYNLRYSGETYAGPVHAATYLITFPVRHARVDALWLLGCGGCAVLLVAAVRARERLVPVAWVAAACLSIAINGSRDLPQYFVQAAPALALAGAWAGSLLWTRWRLVNLAAAVVVAVGVWRVNDFVKLADNTWHDARYIAGHARRAGQVGGAARADHLARYGDRATRKYSALAMAELAAVLEAKSTPNEPVFVFGFSSGAYVDADRTSASRFFWSRPVIVGFNQDRPGYGVGGLLEDLRRHPPAVVALQQRDWYPDVDDSAHFFMSSLPLAGWLRASYEHVEGPAGFDVWVRRQDRP